MLSTFVIVELMVMMLVLTVCQFLHLNLKPYRKRDRGDLQGCLARFTDPNQQEEVFLFILSMMVMLGTGYRSQEIGTTSTQRNVLVALMSILLISGGLVAVLYIAADCRYNRLLKHANQEDPSPAGEAKEFFAVLLVSPMSLMPSHSQFAFVWLQNFMFVGINSKAAEAFVCTTHADGSTTLNANPLIMCWQGDVHIFEILS